MMWLKDPSLMSRDVYHMVLSKPASNALCSLAKLYTMSPQNPWKNRGFGHLKTRLLTLGFGASPSIFGLESVAFSFKAKPTAEILGFRTLHPSWPQYKGSEATSEGARPIGSPYGTGILCRHG